VRPGPDQRWARCPADLRPGQGCRFSPRDPGYPAPPAQSRTCSPCGWLSQPPTTMPDKTPPWHTAVAGLPGRSARDDATRAHAVSGLFTRACPRPVGFIVSPRPGASGLPEFSRVSLPACQDLRTPADRHTPAMKGASYGLPGR
jgi:hypothetical protein